MSRLEPASDPTIEKMAAELRATQPPVGTQSIRLDLSGKTPRVFVDGVERDCDVLITYRKDGTPLTVHRLGLTVKP